MTRFYGEVGYTLGTVVVRPGVSEEKIAERKLYGDVIRDTRRLEGEGVNPDISVGNSISVMADAYFRENFHRIRYVKWAGVNWAVTEVEAQFPRLLLRLGGVYNGRTPSTA